MPCGAGKTITLTDIIRRFDQHTLVIVHTDALLNQWVDYYKEHYNYEVGVIKGQRVDIKPITIASIQTLYARELTTKFLEMWGMVVVDEVHHQPADSFKSVVNLFPAKYRFGTTATPYRSDGLIKMMFAGIGPVISKISSYKLSKLGFIMIPTVKIINTEFHSPKSRFISVVSDLIKDRKRNELIIENVLNHKDSFKLVLSGRIKHLEILAAMYAKHDANFKVVTGAVKGSERDGIIDQMRKGHIKTIFATTIADEGLDIPNLDVVYLTTPTKADGRIEQRIGRVQRVYPGKNTPLVYDFSDWWMPRLAAFTDHRVALYTELGVKIEQKAKYFKSRNF